jgi:hypothetical protein
MIPREDHPHVRAQVAPAAGEAGPESGAFMGGGHFLLRSMDSLHPDFGADMKPHQHRIGCSASSWR